MSAPKFLTTGKLAAYIGVNIRFLKENKDILFRKGEHYFIPAGRVHPLWDVDKMIAWVTDSNDTVDEILKKVV